MVQVSIFLVVFILQLFCQVTYATFTFPNNRIPNDVIARIIGGVEANPHEFPYQVGIYVTYSSSTNFCGGSLISNNYVLTAAHCAEKAISATLIFGAHNISAVESTQVRVTSTDFIVHSGWNDDLLVNDIALIKLPSPINENDYIKIVSLANGSDTFAGSIGTIAGWGKTQNSQTTVTSILRYINSTILSNDDCKSTNSDYNEVIQPTHLCISGKGNSGNIGSCEGDSGGPLVNNGIQLGIVSFGDSNCEAGEPSVFTRVTEFHDWIQSNSDVSF